MFKFVQSSQVVWFLAHLRISRLTELTKFDLLNTAGTYILFGTFDTMAWGGKVPW